jgi:LCP family protein required for cell wall assembly
MPPQVLAPAPPQPLSLTPVDADTDRHTWTIRSLSLDCGVPRHTPDSSIPPTADENPVVKEGAAPTRHRRARRGHRVVKWLGFSLVVVLVAAGGYVFFNYQRFVGGVTHIDAISTPEVDGDTVADVDGTDQNILLVGDDHRPDGATDEDLAKLGTEADDGATNTDTMIVLHIPADGEAATMISFPRDSWVDIPGSGKGKLNSAYTIGSEEGGDEGGAKLLISTIETMTGLTMDHYVRVSMLGFYNVVEALGPVDVCLIEAVDDPYSALKLPAGVSTLNAQQALSFVRQRHELPNGDLDRQVRQQYFLSVEARKILSAGTLLNPFKLGQVLDAVSSAVETDPGLNFIDLAAQMKNLGPDNITSATIPILGTPTIYVGGEQLSIVEVDMDAMPTFINDLLGVPSAYAEAVAAPVGEVTVAVQNARGEAGVAGVGTATLAALGFVTAEPTTITPVAATIIQYPAGQEAAAKAVAAYLPTAAVVESTTVTGVTVTLGTDGMLVNSTIAAPAPVDPAVPVPVETPAGTTYAAGACIY